MAESVLMYGSSGSSKTSQCAEFHMYERLKAQQLNLPWKDWPHTHVTGDSSFEPLEEVVESGLVQPWNIAFETQLGSSPISAIIALAGGHVPVKTDPKTGQRLSNEFRPATGAVTVEGLHVLAEAWKYHMMNMGLINAQLQDGVNQLGTAHLSIYDMIKNNLHQAVLRMRAMPHVGRFMWTTHEAKGTDQYTASVIGPAILVNKGIDKVPGWFANTIHIQPSTFPTADGKTQSGRVLWFEPHPDPNLQINWPAKTSLTPKKLQRLKARSLEVGGNGSCMPCLIAPDGSIQGGIAEILRYCD